MIIFRFLWINANSVVFISKYQQTKQINKFWVDQKKSLVFLIVFLIIFWAMIQMLRDLKNSNLNDNSAEYLQCKQKQQYNLSSIVFTMKIVTKLILLSLLCVAIYTQSNHNTGDDVYYVEDGQAYLHIYGQGSQDINTHGDRDVNSINLGNQHRVSTSSESGPTPVTIECPHNQAYDNKLCICVCIIGYYFDGEACVPNIKIDAKCKRNQVYQDGRCVCNKGYFLIGDACDICPPYSTYELPRLRCVCAQGYQPVNGKCAQIYNRPVLPVPPAPIKCGLNERILNNICICLEDFFFIKGQCTYCPAPNTYDPQLSICKPKCGLNEVLDLNTVKCVCSQGFNDVNGNCGKCRAYSTYNKRTRECDCVQGYILNNFNCIPQTRAPLIPVPLTPPPIICGNNQNYVDGQCVCQLGYNLIDGACIRCPTGTFYDATLKVCRIPCNANQVYNILSKICECAKASFRINGVCSVCPGQTKYDAQSQLCICDPGFSNVNGICVAGCGVNQVLSNGICCCKTGFYPIGGVCGRCGWDEVYDQGLGICRIPCDQDRIYNTALRRCACLPHFHELANGRCGTCPTNSNYDPITKTCVCISGYIKNLGLCISACNNYEEFVNGKCVCRSGYYLIGYSCGVCPPLTVYDNNYRICRSACKNNEVWDITIRACRCLPGFYLVQGVCSQCNPLTQIYDHKNQCCECKSGYFKTPGQGCNGVCIPRCTENQDWLGNRCVCKPGFFLINNFCTKCPEGQFYDIYERICRIQCGTNQVYNFNTGKCNCAPGFLIIQGTCSKCPADFVYDEYKQECRTDVCPAVNEYYSPTTGLCVCQARYVRIRGVCSNCPPGFYYDSYSDSCLCKPGFKLSNGFCQPICPSDQTFINGKCYCIEGQLKNGICTITKRCPLYSSWDKSTQCCVCNPGYSIINGVCTQYQYCGQNGYLRYGKCYCNAGFYWILNKCAPCGLNQAYNGVVCQCALGYTRDIYGTCIASNFEPNCYNNQRYDSSLKACVCIQGTQYLNSRCIAIPTCGANSYYNGLSCACNTGYTLSNGACTVVAIVVPDCPDNAYFNGVSCSCNTGYSLDSTNGCSQCQAGTVWDGAKCATQAQPNGCSDGYEFSSASNACVPGAASCGEHSLWNGALCACTSNAHQIDGKCQLCAQGTTFDGTKCADDKKITSTIQCGSNQVQVGGKCVCAAGFNSFEGNCIKCPENTEWNGKYCHCLTSNATQWCVGSPYTVFVGGRCLCQQGTILVMGLCAGSK